MKTRNEIDKLLKYFSLKIIFLITFLAFTLYHLGYEFGKFLYYITH